MDLQALREELAEKLQAANQAKDELAEAQVEVDALIAAHPEINTAMTHVDETTTQKRAVEKIWKAAKQDATRELSTLFAERPEDAKIEPAFGVRQSIEPVYNDDIKFIQAVVKAGTGMLFLLKPDHEAITAFVKGMVIEGEHPLLKPYYVIPPKVFDSLPVLGVRTVFKATISDKKL